MYNGGDYEKLNLLYFNKDLYFPELSGNVIKDFTSLNLKFLKTNNDKIIVVNKKQKLNAFLIEIKNAFMSFFITRLDNYKISTS